MRVRILHVRARIGSDDDEMTSRREEKPSEEKLPPENLAQIQTTSQHPPPPDDFEGQQCKVGGEIPENEKEGKTMRPYLFGR